MILLEKTKVVGLEPAIRGMRNPMNSWDRMDSGPICPIEVEGCSACVDHVDNDLYFKIGPNDHERIMKLVKGGPVHAKFRRMINVYVDITAPLYWWKEFDTYKVGTVANSCSTMHKIHEKEFTIDDFSHEHLLTDGDEGVFLGDWVPFYVLEHIILILNKHRNKYIETKNKKYWWQMIQLLPSSYNQKRTIMMNYEVLSNIHQCRKVHKLDEWIELCKWIEGLPYNEIITGHSNRITD